MAQIADRLDATETAAFRGDDPGCLVTAALACRVCLSGDVAFALAAEPWEAWAHCSCRACGHERTLSLTGDQALRLALTGQPAQDAAPAPRYGLAPVL